MDLAGLDEFDATDVHLRFRGNADPAAMKRA
jgi:hypothetical protein